MFAVVVSEEADKLNARFGLSCVRLSIVTHTHTMQYKPLG